MTPLRRKAREGEESPDALKGASYQPPRFCRTITPVVYAASRGVQLGRIAGKRTREEAPRPVQEPSSCLKIVKCVGRSVFIKAYVCTRSFPPRSVTTAARPSP